MRPSRKQLSHAGALPISLSTYAKVLRYSRQSTPVLMAKYSSTYGRSTAVLFREDWGMTLNHQSGNQGQDGVEFRQSGVDHGVGLHIVTLSDTHDTVGANLSLTDG